MYKNTNCFHLAIPCGDLEKAKHFYSEVLGCRLDNAAQEWADVDFWGNELTLHKSDHKLDNERHDVDMGNVSVPHFGVHLSRKDCLLYTSPSPRDTERSRMPSSA